MKYHLKLRIVLAVIATILLFSAAAYMNTDLFDSLLDNLEEDKKESAEEEAEEDIEEAEANASVLVRESRDTDIVLLDDVVTISYICYGTDGYYSDLYDVTVPLYIENLTGQDITVEADIITVNGVDVKDYLIWTYFDLEAGTSAYVEFTIDYDYELSEVGITDAPEITSMGIRVKTQDSDYHTLTSGTYTLTLQ